VKLTLDPACIVVLVNVFFSCDVRVVKKYSGLVESNVVVREELAQTLNFIGHIWIQSLHQLNECCVELIVLLHALGRLLAFACDFDRADDELETLGIALIR
jgi:hypothetical protein